MSQLAASDTPSQRGEYAAPAATVRWETTASDLTIRIIGGPKRIAWTEVSRAGLIYFQAAPMGDVPEDLLLGFGKLLATNRAVAQEMRQLALATTQRKIVRIPIPRAAPDAQRLVEAVQTRLGERWVGDIDIQQHYKALGVAAPWWGAPLSILLLIAAFPLCLLVLSASSVITEGDWELIRTMPLVAWGALAAWLIVAYGLWWVFRRWIK